MLKLLMQGLYYPAVTGTAIVLVLNRLTLHSTLRDLLSDFALWYGVLFILFFSASFVAISITASAQYSIWEFYLDMLEVTLAFAVFFSLGLFQTTTPLPQPDLRAIYGYILLLAIVQSLGRIFLSDMHEKRLWILRVTCIVVAALGLAHLHSVVWFNAIALAVLLACAGAYLWVVRQRADSAGG